MKTFLFGILTMTFAASMSSAATILADDFTGVITPVDNNDATITSWNTLNGVNVETTFEAFTHTGAESFYEDAVENILDVDATTNNAGQGWDVLFDVALDAGTQSIALNTFDLTALVTNGSGQARSLSEALTTWDWTFKITGDGSYGTQSVTDAMSIANGSAPRTGSLSIDISSLDDLVAGENYIFSVGVRFTGTGDLTYIALDSISMDGALTPVPEPSTLALIGLSTLALLLRRRV